MENTSIDTLWLLLSAFLVFTMQAGFLCLESGLTRSKNAINVAIKNLTDFCVAVSLFWLIGFGVMYGSSINGWFGSDHFLISIGSASSPWLTTFFIFQAMFCATAATIVSGAIAERVRFSAYLWITLLIALLIYPLYGHWVWGGLLSGSEGWLQQLGFIDFAGATVVHSTGGWVALAAVLMIGPRTGRFTDDSATKAMPSNNLPMAMLGVLLLFLGWFGFNGGSSLAFSSSVPGILANTMLGAIAGMLAALFLGWRLRKYAEVHYALNGVIAGLVAVTAGAHAFTSTGAFLVGAVGGLVMVMASEWLLRYKIDDAVGAIPAHLAAGIWGTLSVAIFGQSQLLETGLTRIDQLGVQFLGVVVGGIWSFGLAWVALRIINHWVPLRITSEQEQLGLNQVEHGASTETHQLLSQMEQHESKGNLSERLNADPFTEIGEVAAGYNRVLDSLEQSENRTQNLVRNLKDGIITWDTSNRITSVNPGAEVLLGKSSNDIIGRPLSEIFGNRNPKNGERFEWRQRTDSGDLQVLEVQVSQYQADQSGLLRDITERFFLKRELQQERDLSQLTLASIGDAVITVDGAGLIEFMNPEAERLTGWDASSAKGKPAQEVYQLYDDTSGERAPDITRKVLTSGNYESRSDQYALAAKNGQRRPIQSAAAPILSRHGFTVGAVMVFHDITVTRNLTRQLKRQASEDPLTRLPNRRAFEQQLRDIIQDEAGNHLLCYLDLDQFKVVNDTCGHLAGDELLKQLTRILQKIVRDSDTLARLGGDEFGILLLNCPLNKGMEAMERLREAVQDYRFCWEAQAFSIGVSIGMVELGANAPLKREMNTVLSAADAACFAAKEAGRNRVHTYRLNDSELMARQGEMQWLARLQSALDEDRLVLYCQSISPLHGLPSAPKHFEVLVRVSENGQIITPGAFLPAAERYNLISQVDRRVVQKALAWLTEINTKDHNVGMVAVNLSALSLSDPRFREDLFNWVQEARLPLKQLCFEITETAAISQLANVVDFMNQMRTLNCLFSLDDFGSGFSSFGYLKELPVDFLKIDGRLVRDIDTDAIDRVMVQAINTIGKSMGIKTIAEFVENDAIMEHLKAIEVDYAQGWHIGKPMPITTALAAPKHRTGD